MTKNKGIDATPSFGSSSEDFFSEFMPDKDSGLLSETTTDDSDEEDDKAEGADDHLPLTKKEDPKKKEEPETADKKEEGDQDNKDQRIPPVTTEDEDLEENELTSVMTDFVSKGILDIIDEEKEYSPDAEGFQELINDTVEARIKAREQEFQAKRNPKLVELESFLAENPDADITDWAEDQSTVDFSKIDHTDPDNQIPLVEDHLTLQGYEANEIEDTIKGYQKAGLLALHAKRAKDALLKNQQEEERTKSQARQAQKQQQETAIRESRMQFEQKVLKTEKIAGIEIDPKERQAFADYILKPVDANGNTQLILDEKNAEEAQLLYAYILKNKINLAKLERKAESKAAVKFKKKLDKHTDTNAKPRANNEQAHPKGEGNIDRVLDDWNP